MSSNKILNFWFTELTEKQHFAKDAVLDALITKRYRYSKVAVCNLRACTHYQFHSTPRSILPGYLPISL